MVIQKTKDIVGSINAFKGKPDGTYSLETRKEVAYDSGYQVSFVRPEAFLQLNSQDWDDITNSFCQYLGSIAHIGVYNGEAEVSFYSTSLDKARGIMKRCNQESILDWAAKHDNPDLIESWFIINPYFDPKAVVDYAKVLDEIQ